MATPSKIQKIQEESTHHIWLRLCDPFIRTDGNLICPIIKADTSIRVLYTLQEEALMNILDTVHYETGIKTRELKLVKSSSDTDLQGNLFIQCVSPTIIDGEKRNHFKERLKFHLSNITTVKNISVDQVDTTEEIIPQPMISEPDFDMHKLELCYKQLCLSQSDETDALSFIRDSIKNILDELKEKYTKIAILSQNGKGKSFLLNLLFLLTIDNENEYQNNNKKLKLPKDITGDPTIEELGEAINELPDVVKNFLKKFKNTKEKFKKLMESICVELKPVDPHTIQQSKDMFSSLSNYFKAGEDLDDDEPYILPQKDLEHSLESTTKCIIHLRYGTVYQMKVDYFSSENLKQQLFELVLLSRKHTAQRNNANRFITDREQMCLQARFAILTDCNINDINKTFLQRFNTYSDIVLSEEVEKFAGRTELYIGSGRNSTEDRLAIKAILKNLISPQNSDNEEGKWKYRVAAVKEFVVYLPSKLLYGGKEILEMPGTDDSDALALDFIDKGLSKVNALCVMSDFTFRIGEREVKDILNNSRFMQNWKKNPELSSLMLLAYPEKNNQFHFKKGKKIQIEKLKKLEVQKREFELDDLCNLTEMPRTEKMKASVFTSYILPVLHTSIHAQEGTPHEVIQEHACFLKFTGIQKLTSHLDAFISSSMKMDFQQLQKSLRDKITAEDLLANNINILEMYKNREVRDIRENELFHKFNNVLNNLFKKLETVYTNKLDEQVTETFHESATEAERMWDLNEANIITRSAFNPFFAGNHSRSRVKIARIILNNIESLQSEIFTFLKKEIDELLNTFEKESIDLIAQELNDILDANKHSNIDSRIFVEKSIRGALAEARQWYIGRNNKPINAQEIGKQLKKSKDFILRKRILTPAYNLEDLNLAKQLARGKIADAVMDVKEELKTCLLKLHNTRWKSFLKHLKKGSTPKPWQVLFIKSKQSSTGANTQQQQPNELSKLIKLITTNIPK